MRLAILNSTRYKKKLEFDSINFDYVVYYDKQFYFIEYDSRKRLKTGVGEFINNFKGDLFALNNSLSSLYGLHIVFDYSIIRGKGVYCRLVDCKKNISYKLLASDMLGKGSE